MDDLEIEMQRREREGLPVETTREEVREIRRQMEEMAEQMADAMAPHVEARADELRGRRTTGLAATFVGEHAGGECQMTLRAILAGRQGGAQVVTGDPDYDRHPDGEAPGFGIDVYPPSLIAVLLGEAPGRLGRGTREHRGGWEGCFGASPGCGEPACMPGRLVLERAEQGRIAGTFRFHVVKDDADGCPTYRDVVTGHFNVSSTDDGYDDGSLDGIGDRLIIPGSPAVGGRGGD